MMAENDIQALAAELAKRLEPPPAHACPFSATQVQSLKRFLDFVSTLTPEDWGIVLEAIRAYKAGRKVLFTWAGRIFLVSILGGFVLTVSAAIGAKWSDAGAFIRRVLGN